MQFLSLFFILPFVFLSPLSQLELDYGHSPQTHATINSIDDHSAHVFIKAPLLPADSYSYEIRTSGLPGSGENGLVAGGNSLIPELEIQDLMPGTLYTVYIKYNYSGTQMPWILGNTFNTSVCSSNEKIVLDFQLKDSGKDGWNGTILGVKQAGIEIGELYLTDGESNSGTLSICSEEITEIYVKHLGDNSQEITLIVKHNDSNFEKVIHQASPFSNNQVILSHVFGSWQSNR